MAGSNKWTQNSVPSCPSPPPLPSVPPRLTLPLLDRMPLQFSKLIASVPSRALGSTAPGGGQDSHFSDGHAGGELHAQAHSAHQSQLMTPPGSVSNAQALRQDNQPEAQNCLHECLPGTSKCKVSSQNPHFWLFLTTWKLSGDRASHSHL